MVWLMRSGGLPIWVLALFGVWALVMAVLFLRRPELRRLEVVRLLSRATLYATVAAVAASLAAVMTRVPAHPEWATSPDLPLIVMTGLGEALAPAILGFGLLALTSFFAALGVRRIEPPVA